MQDKNGVKIVEGCKVKVIQLNSCDAAKIVDEMYAMLGKTYCVEKVDDDDTIKLDGWWFHKSCVIVVSEELNKEQLHFLYNALKNKISACKGAELKLDFSARNGAIVDAYVAQADIELGITIRGRNPWHGHKDSEDEDLCCINIASYKRNSMRKELYYTELIEVLEDIERGVQIVPPSKGGSMAACAFN